MSLSRIQPGKCRNKQHGKQNYTSRNDHHGYQVNGQRDQILINATWGLDEAIVSGQVTPDTVVVDKSTRKILSRKTATKTMMTVRTDTATAEQAVPQAQQNQQVLDDETAVQLAHYGAQIEAHYAMPMDIEWAIADGKIAILQARPITSLPDPKPVPLPDVVWEPIAPRTIWMHRQIVEHMPEPLSPLFEDLYLNQGMDKTLDKLLAAMAEIGNVSFDFDAMVPHGFTGTINGYAYTVGSFKMSRSNLIAILRIYARFYKFFKLSAFDWDGVVLPDYQTLIKRWGAIDLAETADEVAAIEARANGRPKRTTLPICLSVDGLIGICANRRILS